MTPRWLGWLVVLVALVVLFVELGFWQLGVARDKGVDKSVLAAPTKPVVPMKDLVKLGEPFPAKGSSRRVSVHGHYDAKHQLLVTGRRLHGKAGYWVITPLVVDGTGARVVILRGFVRTPKQATPPTTTGDVTVVGSLAPGESPSTGHHPPGQIGTVDLASLLNRWGGSLYNAFLFGIRETPNATAPGITRVPPPPPNPAGGLRLQNAAYALQWWLFAAFAIYIYGRMLRDDYEARAGLSDADAAGDNGDETPHDSDAASTKDTHA